MDTRPAAPPALDAGDALSAARDWCAAGRRVAIATVVRTWGSSPLPIGSQLAADEHGDFVGSVSGGCIEGAVIEAAQTAIREGRPRLLEFGVSNERAWEVGLSCGGEIAIWVEPVT